MVITREHKHKIKNIIKQINCPKNFECYESQFENVCEVGIVGDFDRIECIEEEAKTCKYGSPIGHGAMCQCPLRYYIAKHFHRNCSTTVPIIT